MAIVFDATVAGTTTNSYVTVAVADDYFERYVYATGQKQWPSGSSTATITLKENYLMAATANIDKNLFISEKYDEEQALQFPRYMQEDMTEDVDVIPTDIINATLEEALGVINGCGSTAQCDGIVSQSMGSTSVQYGFKRRKTISAKAWEYLRDWLQRRND